MHDLSWVAGALPAQRAGLPGITRELDAIIGNDQLLPSSVARQVEEYTKR